jgi:2-keto-4-pentenoate hydratase/2-oxohepta-3-ene-1,7-dioic acid hydratase in catechol pathway
VFVPLLERQGTLSRKKSHFQEVAMLRCRDAVAASLSLLLLVGAAMTAEKKVVTYARFQAGGEVAYGIVDGDRVRCLSGDPFTTCTPTEKTYALSDVKILAPVAPSKILAAAGNYKSHLGAAAAHADPEFFFKPPSCLIADGEKIVIPEGTNVVHHEAELVIVVGRRAKNVPVEKAMDYVLGVTCGNDVSARDWQKNDVQWWRAKGADTFGPCGPFIVAGIDYDDLLLQCRVNGEVRQKQRTSDLIHGVAALVSFASRFVTLEPGDLIFTGTPGKTTDIKPGDIVEVELEGVGVLKNPVAGR